MNLERLFEIQKVLDEKIVVSKGLQGQNLLDKKILALQVELGELANEHRGFKFWSNDQEPRRKGQAIACSNCEGRGRDPYETMAYCYYCNGSGVKGYKDPLLEEYVDCLHFILSIGLDLKLTNINPWTIFERTITRQFIECFSKIQTIHFLSRVDGEVTKETYEVAFSVFVSLGEMLGFTWKQIEQAYLDKNKVNHERQANGY
jgi:dimeric dUTPase (all-alpha-NTP-PPase superfamily)